MDVDRTIRIQQTNQFQEVEHIVITDRIEAASLGLAGISTKGRVFVEGAQHPHMITFLNSFAKSTPDSKSEKTGSNFSTKDP